MVEILLGTFFLGMGLGMLAYATLGRALGFYRPMRVRGGGHGNLRLELGWAGFFSCGGLAVLHSGIWAVLAVGFWIIGYSGDRRARRQHAAEEKALRAQNAVNHPGIFDRPPPTDLDRVISDDIDVFDGGACTYLGKAAKRDIEALVNRFGELPEQGPNDIYLEPEFLEVLPEDVLSEDFLALLQKGFERRDFLVLRWMPRAWRSGTAAGPGRKSFKSGETR